MSDKIELLPCPFCGGAAKLNQRETESLWSHNIVTWSQVGCYECECVGADCCEDDDGSEAVTHWNTRAALAQQPAPVAVPVGWKLVPIKPEIEMVEAGYEASLGQPDRSGHARVIEVFDAMLAAAPAAPVAAAQEPVAFDYPEYHEQGMGCGLEDRGITDRYEACRYGFDEAVDQMARIIDGIGPLYTAPPATEQPAGTTSDKYRAELYDEVWDKARGMGYGNVTMALAELERMKAAEQPDAVGSQAFVSSLASFATQARISDPLRMLQLAAEQPNSVKVRRELLEQLAGDLATEVEARYSDKNHPALKRKYELDMLPVLELRALLAGGEA